MEAKERVKEELEYAILNYELDLNTWKIKINREKNEKYLESMKNKLLEIEEALEMFKIKKELLDDRK